MKKMCIRMVFCLALVLLTAGVGVADTITVELENTTIVFMNEFPNSTLPYAYTRAWSGDVKMGESVVGEFTASYTSNTDTGSNGYVVNYDVVVPNANPRLIAEFLSIRTVNKMFAGKGMVYATSPGFLFLLNASVTIDRETMAISY